MNFIFEYRRDEFGDESFCGWIGLCLVCGEFIGDYVFIGDSFEVEVMYVGVFLWNLGVV